MAKVYVRLKDKGTSFHDVAQGKGVVGDQVGHLHLTPKVTAAIRGGALEKLDDTKGKKLFDAQPKAGDEPAEKKPSLADLDKGKYDDNTVAELKVLVEGREGLVVEGTKKADYIKALEADDAKKEAAGSGSDNEE